MICINGYCLIDKLFDHKQKLQHAIGYAEYKSHIDGLLKENKTTGGNHSPEMLHYTRMNVKRMQRWDKMLSIEPELCEMLVEKNPTMTFFVISEAWCGDAAHSLPVLNKITEFFPNIDLKIIERDEHPELMDAYLTNGNRSIPVVIGLLEEDGEYREVFKWGPGPEKIIEMKRMYKEGLFYDDVETYEKAVQMWYNQDKSISMQQELKNLLSLCL